MNRIRLIFGFTLYLRFGIDGINSKAIYFLILQQVQRQSVLGWLKQRTQKGIQAPGLSV